MASEIVEQTVADLYDVVRGPSQRPIFSPPQEGGALPQQRSQVIRLVATRHFGFGEPVAREQPLLRAPADSSRFLLSVGTEAMKEVAKRLGDTSRLATFLAYTRLPEPQREQLLQLEKRSSSKVADETLQISHMFLNDFPQFKDALDWALFAKVVGIVSDRGIRLPSGEYAIYAICGSAAHSFTPNAVIERRGDSENELRAIAYRGIAADEEITVNYLSEEKVFLPQSERSTLLATVGECNTTENNSSGANTAELLHPILQRVKKVRAKRAKDVEVADRIVELRGLLEDLKCIDNGLPFAMVAKATARTNLASAFEGLESGDMLRIAISLYQAAVDDSEVCLGGGSRTVVENLRRRINALGDQLEEA